MKTTFMAICISILPIVVLTTPTLVRAANGKSKVTFTGGLFFADERNDTKTSFPLNPDITPYRGAANVVWHLIIKTGDKEDTVAGGVVGWDGKFKTNLEFKNPPQKAKARIKFFLKNAKWHLEGPLGGEYNVKTEWIEFNPAKDGTVSFGSDAPYAGTTYHEAMHVFASVNEAWNFGKVSGWEQGDLLKVVWPNYKVEDGEIVTNDNGDPVGDGMSNATSKRIKINYGKWKGDFGTVYHEYGHVVQQRTVALPFGDYCQIESMASTYEEGDGCWHNTDSQEFKDAAFQEGWAIFYEYSTANFVVPGINDNQYDVYQQAEFRSVNPYDDENEGNAASVLVDLMDNHYDEHGSTLENFQLSEKTKEDGSTFYYYDFDQVTEAGFDSIHWDFQGVLAILSHLAVTDNTEDVGIKEYVDELVVMCDQYKWKCKNWDDSYFNSFTKTSWVNLNFNTAPDPYEW